MNMDIVQAIAQQGILIVIAAIFLWDAIVNKKTMTNILTKLEATTAAQTTMIETIKMSTEATTTALTILQNETSSQNALTRNLLSSFEHHDRRAEHMNADVIQIKAAITTKSQVKIDSMTQAS